MVCKKCGKEINEGERFCSNCGYQVENTKNKKEKRGLITRLKNILLYNKYRLELLELKDKGEITEKELKKKLSKVFIDSIIFTLAIIIIPVVLFLGGYTIVKNINDAVEKSKEVIVPNLIGKTISEAEENLAPLDLNIKAENANLSTIYSDSPDAIIVTQKDEEGKILKKGNSVRVEAKTKEQIEKQKQEEEERERKRIEAKEKGYRSSPASTKTIEGCAQTLISNNLRSSSTARWGTCEKIDEDNYGRCLVYVSLEAQNGFGAYSKLNYLVVLQYVESNGEFTYKPYTCMHELTTFTGQDPYYYYVKEYKSGNVFPVIETFLKNNDWNIRPEGV